MATYSLKYAKSNIKDKDIYDTNWEIKDKELTMLKIVNGTILPYKKCRNMTYGLSGVLDANDNFVKESGFILPINDFKELEWGGKYKYNEKERQYIDRKCIFAGFINNNEWGHFLVDWSVKLWYAIEIDNQSEIVFCIRAKKGVSLLKNIQRCIELAGISLERIKILYEDDFPVKYKEIIIPESSLDSTGYTKEFLFFYDSIKNNLPKLDLETFDKIYFTRTRMKNKKEYGEKEIEELFEKNGYKVIAPEQISTDEQVHYIKNCKELVCMEGSAAHNIVFSSQGIKQIILEKQSTVNMRQIFLNEIKDSSVIYIGIYPKYRLMLRNSSGPYIVGITDSLNRYFLDNYLVRDHLKSKWIVNYLQYLVHYFVADIGYIPKKMLRRMFR